MPHYILLLALLISSQPVATDLYLPALPAVAAELGNPSLSLTALLLSFGASQLVAGPLADHYGRRPLIVWGLALFTTTSFLAAFASSMSMLVGLRVIQGMGMSSMIVAGRASVRDLYEPKEGARILSGALSWLGVAAFCSPLIGAFIAMSGHWRGAFLAVSVYGFFAWLAVFYLFKETLSPERMKPSVSVVDEERATISLLKSPRFRAWTLLSAATYCTLFCFLLSSSFVYIRVFGFSAIECGLVLSANSAFYICGTFICRRLLARVSPARACQIASLVPLTGGLLLLLFTYFYGLHAWALIVAQGLFTLSHGISLPCSQVGSIADFPQFAGRAAALNGFLMMAASFSAGQIMAPYLGASAWPLLVSIVSGSCLVAFLAWVVLPRASIKI